MEQPLRFHQALTFLPVDEAIAISTASDRLGYDGAFVSDHLFNPRQLSSRYTYSTTPDGSPFWEKETAWPDPMCLISALAAVTRRMTFTTGIYIAPARDLITVAKSVGTASVISHGRVRLGVGVGWCEEEYAQTGQDFRTRGRRLDEMIPALRALWSGGWVEWHGTYYDVPACQMNPSPPGPVPILGGGDSDAALRRATTLCDGWINTGAVTTDEAFVQVERVKDWLKRAGREREPYSIYVAVSSRPDADLYRRLADAGVTDLLCAPWMGAMPADGQLDEDVRATRIEYCELFAEHVMARVNA